MEAAKVFEIQLIPNAYWGTDGHIQEPHIKLVRLQQGTPKDEVDQVFNELKGHAADRYFVFYDTDGARLGEELVIGAIVNYLGGDAPDDSSFGNFSGYAPEGTPPFLCLYWETRKMVNTLSEVAASAQVRQRQLLIISISPRLTPKAAQRYPRPPTHGSFALTSMAEYR